MTEPTPVTDGRFDNTICPECHYWPCKCPSRRPTPAQIEAAAKVINAEYDYGPPEQKVLDLAKAALTAAAEVKHREIEFQPVTIEPAAAEVGEQDKALMASGLDALASVGIDGHAAAVQVAKKTMAKLIECEKREAATIERCIEAAEWFRNIERYSLDDVIARIRALKEE